MSTSKRHETPEQEAYRRVSNVLSKLEEPQKQRVLDALDALHRQRGERRDISIAHVPIAKAGA